MLNLLQRIRCCVRPEDGVILPEGLLRVGGDCASRTDTRHEVCLEMDLWVSAVTYLCKSYKTHCLDYSFIPSIFLINYSYLGLNKNDGKNSLL